MGIGIIANGWQLAYLWISRGYFMNKGLYSALNNDGQGKPYSEELLQALVENLLPGIQILKPEVDGMGEDEPIDFRFAFSDKTIPEQDGKPEGKELSRLFPAIKDNGLHEFLVNVKKRGLVINEVINYSNNGKEGWFHLKIQPYEDGLIIQREDITELKTKVEKKVR